MGNWWKHLKTISHHKLIVTKYCFRVGLYRQGLLHDLSKFGFTEFRVGAKYYQGDRSPNVIERNEIGYSTAWLHHKGRNKHHLEYWVDYLPENGFRMSGLEMPVKYVVEMFCDRIAACRVYQKEKYTDASPWQYYDRSRETCMIHPKTARLLEDMLLMLRDEGEEKAIAYIRREILKNG